MLYEQGGNILEAHQFDDIETGRFFMRVVFNFPLADNIDLLRTAFGPLAQSYGMDWNIRSRSQKNRVLLLASKFDHCLADLLYRLRIGELRMDLVGDRKSTRLNSSH